MISLRPAKAEDAGLLASWFNDRDNTKYMEDTTDFYYAEELKNSINKDSADFIAMLDGTPVGYCSLYDFDGKGAESSVLIGEKDAQGRGYGSGILKALCETAFHDIGLEEIRSYIDEDNLPAIGMCLSCGFKVVGKRGRDVALLKKKETQATFRA